ncbi:hypothetical protein BH10PSE19_BH10PSE19_21990 [soil metagenome]
MRKLVLLLGSLALLGTSVAMADTVIVCSGTIPLDTSGESPAWGDGNRWGMQIWQKDGNDSKVSKALGGIQTVTELDKSQKLTLPPHTCTTSTYYQISYSKILPSPKGYKAAQGKFYSRCYSTMQETPKSGFMFKALGDTTHKVNTDQFIYDSESPPVGCPAK